MKSWYLVRFQHGMTDTVTRIQGKSIRQSVVVENRSSLGKLLASLQRIQIRGE